MTVCAIVPVKGLESAKGRLRDILSPAERRDLTLWMLGRVLRALGESAAVGPLYVVTPDARVAAAARDLGATPVKERGGGLNAALEGAREVALSAGAAGALFVLGDLPLLSARDVGDLVACGEGRGACVAAPDRHNRGTNVLLLRPPAALPLLFGTASYERHAEAARERDVRLETYRSEGTSFDVDTPDDLRTLRERAGLAGGEDIPVCLAEGAPCG